MKPRQCEWLVGCVRRCAANAKFYIEFLDGEKQWYCAEHYDIMAAKIKAMKFSGAQRVVKRNNL